MFDLVQRGIVECGTSKERVCVVRLFVHLAVGIKQTEAFSMLVALCGFEGKFEFTEILVPLVVSNFENVRSLRDNLKATL